MIKLFLWLDKCISSFLNPHLSQSNMRVALRNFGKSFIDSFILEFGGSLVAWGVGAFLGGGKTALNASGSSPGSLVWGGEALPRPVSFIHPDEQSISCWHVRDSIRVFLELLELYFVWRIYRETIRKLQKHLLNYDEQRVPHSHSSG